MLTTELISTAYLPAKGGYIAKQLYCQCGHMMWGELFNDEISHEYIFECAYCGKWINGRDAECLAMAFWSDLI